MPITTFQIGSAPVRGEGLRIGTVRFLPRGVPKKDYARLGYFDVWLPLLAPSRELLKWFKKREPSDATCRQFFSRYRRQLLSDTDARQTLLLLGALGRSTTFSVGCYCEDESKCHRSQLLRLLKATMN